MLSPSCTLAGDVPNGGARRARVVCGCSGVVAANVCIRLCIRLLECWNSIAMAPMTLCMLVAWVVRVSVEASIRLSVLRLMLFVRVVSLSSTVATKSLIVLVNSFSETKGDEVALCIAWAFCARTSRTGACASRIAVGFGEVPSMLPLCGKKSTRLPKM